MTDCDSYGIMSIGMSHAMAAPIDDIGEDKKHKKKNNYPLVGMKNNQPPDPSNRAGEYRNRIEKAAAVFTKIQKNCSWGRGIPRQQNNL